MTTEQNFKEEFPRVYRMFHEPAKFGPDVILAIERRVRKFLLWLIKLLIVYVVLARLWEIHQSVGEVTTTPSEWIVRNWMVGRNLLFLLVMVFEVPLLVLAFIIQAFRGRLISAGKSMITGILLLNLIVFSYALAGLATDLVYAVLMMWNYMLVNTSGSEVKLDVYEFIRGIGK